MPTMTSFALPNLASQFNAAHEQIHLLTCSLYVADFVGWLSRLILQFWARQDGRQTAALELIRVAGGSLTSVA